MIVEAGSIVVSPAVAARLAPLLARFAKEWIRDGGCLAPDVAATIAEFQQVARARRSAVGTVGIPAAVELCMMPAMTVRQAAEVLSISHRAVRARCERGTMPARKGPGGEWLIDPLDLQEKINCAS